MVMLALAACWTGAALAAPHGGEGGLPFFTTCGEHAAVVALKLRSGHYVDSLQLVCRRITADGLGKQYTREPQGGSGGEPVQLDCPPGEVVKGISGAAGSLLDRLSLHCAPLQIDDDSAVPGTAAAGSVVGPAGGPGGTAFTEDACPPGEIARGLDGRAGTMIDRIELVCHRPVAGFMELEPRRKMPGWQLGLIVLAAVLAVGGLIRFAARLFPVKPQAAEPGSDVPFDPAALRDALALKTGWTPMRTGGVSLRTHKMLDRGGGRLEFQPTRMALVICWIIASSGVTGAMGLGLAMLHAPQVNPQVFLLAGVVNLAFSLGFAGWYYRRNCTPRIFDLTRGWYWVGREPALPTDSAADAKSCRLADVHALQLLRERCHAKHGSFWSYELNLVLRDARRVHVVDHGERQALLNEATTLAALLRCKLWDAAG